MRRALRYAALFVLLACFGWWWTTGRNTGFTKNTVQEWKVDEITEIRYPVEVPRYVPGLDFLAMGAAGAFRVVRPKLSAVEKNRFRRVTGTSRKNPR